MCFYLKISMQIKGHFQRGGPEITRRNEASLRDLEFEPVLSVVKS